MELTGHDPVERGLRRRRLVSGRVPDQGTAWHPLPGCHEEIRILELSADRPEPRRLVDDAAGDFYLADDAHLIHMYYTEGGEPLAAETDTSPASVTAYRRIADIVWSEAEPFEQWWAANQQFHRDYWSA
jgi:hypothetical protein